MGRIARNDILYNGCYAHVFSRTFEKRKIFKFEDDFKYFKELLFNSRKKYGYKIHHYSIMHTHFHLVVTIGNVEKFSMALQILKKKYAGHYNFLHKRFGPLWRERFKSLIVENEQYLYACGLYVEQNPVEAGLVKKSEDWEYSSSRYYLRGQPDQLIDSYAHGQLPPDMDLQDTAEFTKGMGIGGALFKIYLRDTIDS